MPTVEGEWKATKYENYEVSIFGEVRRVIAPGIYRLIKSDPVQIPGGLKVYKKRLIWETFNGELPEGKVVLGGPELGNMHLAKEKRAPRKTKTADIISLHLDGVKNADIARQLGITEGAVSHCLNRHNKKK